MKEASANKSGVQGRLGVDPDIENGHAITRAVGLIIFAGELTGEILGHFPWEFELMIENVVSFGRSTGLPETKISRL